MEKKYIVDDEWEWYIGQLFFKLIEKDTPKVVVELAPGIRHKIAVALAQKNFSGTIYVVDANKDSIAYTREKYQSLLKNAKIVCIEKEFSKALKELPGNIDLFLANHVLDDMILESYISQKKYDKMLSLEKGEDFLEKWQNLSKDDICESLSKEVTSLFEKFLAEKNVKKVVMSQYRSNLFFLGKDDVMEKIVRPVFDTLKSKFMEDDKEVQKALSFHPFGDDERYLGDYLLKNTQNPKHWIVGSYIKQK